MGIKCVLISGAGIIICRKLTESLLCFSDQTLNWHWTAESLPPSSAWVTARRRVFHSSPSFASCAELKVSVSKAAQLRSQRDPRLAPCDACMCQYTCHLRSAEKGRVCGSTLRIIKGLKWLEGTGWGFQRSSNQQARDKDLYSPSWTRSALLVRVYLCTLVC